MKKRKNPDHPVCIFGKVVFEFFNNEDETFKQNSLQSLAKTLRKELNISCLPVEEFLVENPERGALVLSLSATNMTRGKEVLGKALAFLDAKAPARIVDESFEEVELN